MSNDLIERLRGVLARVKSARHRLSRPGEPAWYCEEAEQNQAEAALRCQAVNALPTLLDTIEALRAEIAAKDEALRRQCDNMAFALNNFDVPSGWYDKFTRELAEARAALKEKPEAPRTSGGRR